MFLFVLWTNMCFFTLNANVWDVLEELHVLLRFKCDLIYILLKITGSTAMVNFPKVLKNKHFCIQGIVCAPPPLPDIVFGSHSFVQNTSVNSISIQYSGITLWCFFFLLIILTLTQHWWKRMWSFVSYLRTPSRKSPISSMLLYTV